MNKIEILEKVESVAKLYEKNLCGKEVLFITDSCEIFKVKFSASNFLHFTGLKTKLSAKDFYTACLNDRITPDDIDKDFSNFVEQKLIVLPSIMSIHKVARMIGTYDNTGIYLKTDKLIGNVFSSLGIKKIGNSYIPNSVIKDDIRKKVIKPISRIILIAIKKDNELPRITYKSDNCDIQKIIKETSLVFDISQISTECESETASD